MSSEQVTWSPYVYTHQRISHEIFIYIYMCEPIIKLSWSSGFSRFRGIYILGLWENPRRVFSLNKQLVNGWLSINDPAVPLDRLFTRVSMTEQDLPPLYIYVQCLQSIYVSSRVYIYKLSITNVTVLKRLYSAEKTFVRLLVYAYTTSAAFFFRGEMRTINIVFLFIGIIGLFDQIVAVLKMNLLVV